MDIQKLQKLSTLLRYDILTSTTQAGSGHPTSSLSSVELMNVLFFGASPAGEFFKYDLEKPKNITNDRFILSKGHASPLLYSLYHAADIISYKELMTLRTLHSPLEGHPTPHFPYVDVATGSLGQGLSVGIGMALAMRLKLIDSVLPHIWVLLGDSEMAEGQVWEAMELASYYKLHNLIGIIDVNRLGQRGETMLGWDIDEYAHRCRAFGWRTIELNDGHDLEKIQSVFQEASNPLHNERDKRPTMIVAKTIKGKGVSFLENQEGWHGKTLSQEQLQVALKELGKVDLQTRGTIQKPAFSGPVSSSLPASAPYVRAVGALPTQHPKTEISTREAYGNTLVELGKTNEAVVVLDTEVSNSTYANKFKDVYPDRFFEMFIAEQNMVSVAVGMQTLGLIPFCSTFASFLTRAFDQLRMAQYSNANIKIVGSHTGVAIGQDGPSQMGLEDIAMMRSLRESVVFSPSDPISTTSLTSLLLKYAGIGYVRTMRSKFPTLYNTKDEFKIGGSKLLRQSQQDAYVVFATGVSVHESLKAHAILQRKGIEGTIVDIYSIKPIDEQTIVDCARRTKRVVVVEDHYPDGGLGDAVNSVLTKHTVPFSTYSHLCVKKLPHSGKPEELLAYEEINAEAIVKTVFDMTS